MKIKDYCLKIACMDRKLEKVSKLVEKGANVNSKDSAGFTPLHLAVDAEDEAICLFLIEKGASINARSEEGFTPLHLAANFDYEKMVKLLLKAGASPLMKSIAGKIAKDFATKDSKIYKMLVRAEKKRRKNN